MSEFQKNYRSISIKKLLQRQSQIPKEWLLSQSYHEATNLMGVPASCGILSAEECKITSNFDATALLEKLKLGDWSAEQVVIAFCKRAAIAHQLVSVIVTIVLTSRRPAHLYVRPTALPRSSSTKLYSALESLTANDKQTPEKLFGLFMVFQSHSRIAFRSQDTIPLLGWHALSMSLRRKTVVLRQCCVI